MIIQKETIEKHSKGYSYNIDWWNFVSSNLYQKSLRACLFTAFQ